jgi:hypothetical protein
VVLVYLPCWWRSKNRSIRETKDVSSSRVAAGSVFSNAPRKSASTEIASSTSLNSCWSVPAFCRSAASS